MTKKRQQRKNTNPGAKPKRPTAFDALKYVNDQLQSLRKEFDSSKLANETAFQVSNAAIDELRVELDQVKADLAAARINFSKLKSRCDEVIENRDPAPLPDHVAKVAAETFGHGAVFQSEGGSRWRLLKIAKFSDLRGVDSRKWAWDNGSSLTLADTTEDRPTLQDLFPGNNGNWHPVRP